MDSQKKDLYLTVALDLGGKNTGLFISRRYSDQDLVTESKNYAATIILPDEANKLATQKKDRTANRHRVRANKRLLLARRLVFLVIHERLSQLGITLDEKTQNDVRQAVSSLLLRRGYSRLETEIDRSVLDQLDPYVLCNLKGFGWINQVEPISEQWIKLCNDETELLKIFPAGIEVKALEADFKEYFPEFSSEKKIYLNAFKAMNQSYVEVRDQKNMGHLPRAKVFYVLEAEIEKDSRLNVLKKAFGSCEQLRNLVANLSNLHLRDLRWYFDDKAFSKGDRFDSERLRRILIKAYRYLHADDSEYMNKDAIRNLIKTFEDSPDIIKTLCELDPKATIPCYEDQNNRRPPFDRTLWLNPNALTKKYGDAWKLWSQKLLANDEGLREGLDEILKLTDRKSRIRKNKKNVASTHDYELSYILQRAMDRTKISDPYSLRLLAQNRGKDSHSQTIKSKRSSLETVLGSQNIEQFLEFAEKYYSELRQSQMGLRNDLAENLLEAANIHPPMKNKILGVLVGNLLGESKEIGEKLLAIWHDKVKGASSLASVCRSIERHRKDLGNEFDLDYREALRKKEAKQAITSEDKSMLKIKDKVDLASSFIVKKLGLAEEKLGTISNPFSLAQLYTLIDTETRGFTSISLAAHMENAWRMKRTYSSDGEVTVNASRLSSDAVRPFDGQLAMILDRTAWEVVKQVKRQLSLSEISSESKIDIGLIIEENRFEFEAGLATIKKSKLLKSRSETKLKRQAGHWKDKLSRIKESNDSNVCPYTGETIGENGEVDHIIPRSSTKAFNSTVFNSEANLIYASKKGNQIKTDNLYFLKDLNDKYLDIQFGTTDREVIKTRIEKTVKSVLDKGLISPFYRLTEGQQKCLRHALFLPCESEIRQEVICSLNASLRTRVNGTQAYLIRLIDQKLRQELSEVIAEKKIAYNFFAVKTDAVQGREIRDAISKEDAALAKCDVQPFSSHAIDALCAFASACTNEKDCNALHGAAEFGFCVKDNPVRKLLPASCEVIRVSKLSDDKKTDIASRKLFKDGIISQSFLNLYQSKGDLFIGFEVPASQALNKSNVLKITGNSPESLLTLLSEFLEYGDTGINDVKIIKINRDKAFKFLKDVSNTEKGKNKEDIKIAELLDAMTYITAKSNVASALLEANGKKYKEKDAFIDRKKFEIKVYLRKGIDFECKGKLLLPAYASWKSLRERPELSEIWGAEAKEDLLPKLAKIFNSGSKRPHHSTRRVYSLPTLATAAGLIRIERKTDLGEPIYQMCNPEIDKFVGFKRKESGADFKSPVINPLFLQSNLGVVKNTYTDKCDAVLSMNAWRKVYESDELSIWISPNSSNRRAVRVETTLGRFSKLVQENYSSQWLVPAEIKLKELQNLVDLGGKNFNLLGKPRSNLFVDSTGSRVVFEYIVESSNRDMNQAFNEGSEV